MSKKISLILYVVIFTLVGIGLAMLLLDYDDFGFEIIIIGILLVLFAVQFILRRVPFNKDTVLEDEFSKKILNKAAARSYYISLYLWLGLMYFSNSFDNIESVFGIGIASMGILFMLNIIYIKITGLDL